MQFFMHSVAQSMMAAIVEKLRHSAVLIQMMQLMMSY